MTNIHPNQIPQILENHRNRSASALSLPFILIWLLGDICNLVGAVWAGLVPTVIAIGVYFIIADTILLAQCLYYKRLNTKSDGSDAATAVASSSDASTYDDEENEPLLSRSSERVSPETARENGALVKPQTPSKSSQWLRNILSIVMIFVVGALGWAAAWRSGAWRPPVEPGDEGGATTMEGGEGPIGAQVLGYTSAVLYLGARIPQIVKNAREKSCEGWSPLPWCRYFSCLLSRAFFEPDAKDTLFPQVSPCCSSCSLSWET